MTELNREESWENEFDSKFDYLNARHTNEQWDDYKDFIRDLIHQARESSYNDGAIAGYEKAYQRGAREMLEKITEKMNAIDAHGLPTSAIAELRHYMIGLRAELPHHEA